MPRTSASGCLKAREKPGPGAIAWLATRRAARACDDGGFRTLGGSALLAVDGSAAVPTCPETPEAYGNASSSGRDQAACGLPCLYDVVNRRVLDLEVTRRGFDEGSMVAGHVAAARALPGGAPWLLVLDRGYPSAGLMAALDDTGGPEPERLAANVPADRLPSPVSPRHTAPGEARRPASRCSRTACGWGTGMPLPTRSCRGPRADSVGFGAPHGGDLAVAVGSDGVSCRHVPPGGVRVGHAAPSSRVRSPLRTPRPSPRPTRGAEARAFRTDLSAQRGLHAPSARSTRLLSHIWVDGQREARPLCEKWRTKDVRKFYVAALSGWYKNIKSIVVVCTLLYYPAGEGLVEQQIGKAWRCLITILET